MEKLSDKLRFVRAETGYDYRGIHFCDAYEIWLYKDKYFISRWQKRDDNTWNKEEDNRNYIITLYEYKGSVSKINEKIYRNSYESVNYKKLDCFYIKQDSKSDYLEIMDELRYQVLIILE